MKFCVLLCTYNRPGLLAGALSSIVDGTSEKPDRLVVVNGGAEDADAVIRSFQGRGQVEVVLVKTVNKNLAASRNVGLPYCDGDIVAMTDDDAEVFPDWVSRMKSAHRDHPEAGAVGGRVIGAESDSIVGKAADLVTFPDWPDVRHVGTLPGVNISYKLDALRRIGPQDETLLRGEDVDFNWRLHQAGYKVLFDPAVGVRHHHRATLRGLLHQHYMYGRAYFWVRRKWPEMYCSYPRRLRAPKDFLKLAHFLVAPFYEPALKALRLANPVDSLLAWPVLFAVALASSAGAVWESVRALRRQGGG